MSLIHFDTDPELVACILLLIVSSGWQATRLTKEDIEDAARVICSGGGASAISRVDGVLCSAAGGVVQFQLIRAPQNAGGEQERLLRLAYGAAVITDAGFNSLAYLEIRQIDYAH